MNLLNKLTIKNLKLNKKRTIVTIIGIMLSIALITAVSSMFFSVKTSFINYEKSHGGDYHYLFENVSKKDFSQFELNKKIETVNYVYNYGYSSLDGIINEDKPYIFVKGYTNESLENLGIVLLEGNLPKNANEILVPSHLKYNGGVEFKVGDTITLNIGDRLIDGVIASQNNPFQHNIETLENTKSKQFKVVGIMERPDAKIEPYTAPGYTMITYISEKDIEDVAEVYVRYTKAGLRDSYRTTANILGVNPDYYYEVKYIMQNIVDKDLKTEEIKKNKKYTEQRNHYLITLENNFFGDDTMVGLGSAAIVVVIVIIFTSVFCIKNSFDISITEKIRQYGMLSSIGATRKQIKKNVYYEALILGIIGIPLGILLGLFATSILVIISDYLLSSAFQEGFTLTFELSFIAILFSIILGLITIILSARKSAKRASKISPIVAIRNSEDIKVKKTKLKSPKLIKKLFGIGGVISYKNLKRSKKKYRTTVVSIVVSIIVYIAVTGFINVAFSFIEYELPTDEYNITINYQQTKVENANIYETIKNIENVSNVEKYSYTSYTDYYITNPKYSDEYLKAYPNRLQNISSDGERLDLVIVSKNEFERYAKSVGIDPKTNKMNGILVNTIYDYYIDENNKNKIRELDMFGYKKGDILSGGTLVYDTYMTDNEDEKLLRYDLDIKIAGITNEVPMGYSNPYHPIIVLSEENTNVVINETRQKDIFIDSSDADKTYDELKEMFIDYDVHIFNMDEEARMMKSLYILIAIFLYGFITVIALIGITNIFNTITTNMSLRQREFATLKSIGMTNTEFNRMIRLETLFYSSKSLLIGLPIGTILTYIIYLLFSEGELIVKYVFPWSAIIIVCLVLFILIFAIMKYSLSKIKKQNTIETIRNENI